MSVPKESSLPVSKNVLSGSGSYNVRASEVAREKKQSSVNISIVLLDHTEVVFKVNKRDRGQILLDLIFQHLRVTEVKFFSLQFPNDVPDTMRWLDPAKSIRKQFKRGYPYILFFRVKFYATDISSMKDEFTRYQLFLQIKLDLLERRLQCHSSVAAMIASYVIQSELGDYNSKEHKNNYISEFKFLPNQTEDFEAEIKKLHKMHKGLTPVQAEYHMIKRAQKLDMYGIEMHHAKDNDDVNLDVGVTSSGMMLYQHGSRINQLKWSAIVKISFKRKQFYVQLRSPRSEANASVLIYSFHMDNYRACKRLWKSCVDFHSFYRLDRCMNSSYVHKQAAGTDAVVSQPAAENKSEKHRFGFLTLGGRAKYRENEDCSNVSSDNMSQHRPYLRGRVGSAKSKDNVGSFHGEETKLEERAPRRLSAPPSMSYGIGGTGISDEDLLNLLKQNGQPAYIEKSASVSESVESVEIVPSPAKIPFEVHSPDPALAVSFSQLHVRTEAVAGIDEVTATELSAITAPDSECSSVMTSAPEKSYVFPSAPTLPFPYQSSTAHQANGVPEGFVVVRIKPDEDGRYGFNVKGGADLNLPVTVSKVAPESPASKCDPSLHEGDYVLQINGRDILSHSHEQVVRFIRSTREHHTGQLVLLIRPAQYKITEGQSELPLKPLPIADFRRSTSVQDEGAFLHKSMQWLEDMLDSGDLLGLFDSLYRKKPGATMTDARLPPNIPKNRYRDISPYDSTRIHLKRGTTDYINANYVNMYIPGNEWTNKYAASQGPLPNTTLDFWAMVWELDVSFIVMLTTLVERGRTKCHQYWPNAGMTAQFGPWIVESISEKITQSFAYRDFKLHEYREDDNGDIIPTPSRVVQQMQYIAWPDHGVPDDSSDFLDFVLQVRQKRVGMEVPCVVHCSAGIGRTGVLITMETAMCLIEANQPVYPIEIARTMRDQRAMMIQTPGQFKFVCEAILRVYKEGLAKPLLDDDFEDQNNSDADDDTDTSLINNVNTNSS